MFTVHSVGATEILARLNMRVARMALMGHGLDEAAGVVYEQTRQWYDSRGDGTWPELAESTVARKAAQGASDPSRPLYAEGNLFESVTSASGPYSYLSHPGEHGVLLGVDWDEGGWQIPVVLHGGTTSAGVNHDVTIPPRPIWPAHSSEQYRRIREQVRLKLREAIEL